MGRRYYYPLALKAIRTAHIVTVSDAVAREIQETFQLPPERITAAPLGVSSLPQVDPETRSRPYILTVGSLEPRKNLQMVVDAFQRSDVSHDYELVVVGRAAWGETPRGVTVISGATDARLSALYRGASALIVGSIYEGFGLPLVEAMSVGTPVYCSDIPVFREVAGECGTYFDPFSSDSIEDALTKLSTDTSLAAKESAIRRSAKFTWRSCAQRVAAAYETAISNS